MFFNTLIILNVFSLKWFMTLKDGQTQKPAFDYVKQLNRGIKEARGLNLWDAILVIDLYME